MEEEIVAPPASRNFYVDLPTFSNFAEFTNDERFVCAPDDWFVVITDVKGSTRAIDAGRQKEVNTVGAASISIVSDLLKEDFPYFFGGDGATLLAPPAVIDSVLKALQRLQRLSLNQFQLALRVGRITVGEVRQSGHVIEVARRELTAGKYAAVFRGGGLEEAERRIKDDERRYCCAPEDGDGLALSDLSCRWDAFPSRHGQIASLLVRARVEPHARVYEDFLDLLSSVFKGRLDDASPVNLELTQCEIVQGVNDGSRSHTKNAWFWLNRVLPKGSAKGLRDRLSDMFFGSTYDLASLRAYGDHCKFDGMLRLALDCSDSQVVQIRAYLEARRVGGELCYGMHLSETALVSCYARGEQGGPHIHFIDGGDGGYAMASRQLKRQAFAVPPKNAPVVQAQPAVKRDVGTASEFRGR